MGMAEKDFDYSSPRYLMLRLNGLRKAQNYQMEFAYKNSWQQARFIAFNALRAHVKISSPNQLITFPWESPEADIPDYETIKHLFPKYFA